MPLPSPAHALAPLLLALTLAGCATPPPSGAALQTTAQVPQAWLAAANPQSPDAPLLAHWWTAFRSPELNSLVDRALAHNTDLRVARATLRQARATRLATEAAQRPQLSLGSSATRSQADGAGGSNLFKLGFSASWEPDLSGSLSAAQQAAEADERASAADLASTRMSLAAEVALAWLNWRDAQARAQLTRLSLASLEDTQALARWQAQAGLASALDLEQAVLNTEQTRASLAALDAEAASDAHALAQLCALAPAELRSHAAAEAAPIQADLALQQLAQGVPADLLRRRPDLRAAEAAVQAAWLRREQTRREGWPGLSLSGTLGLQAVTLAGLGQAGAGLATLAGAVNWSLLDGGQRPALVEAKDAALEAALARYDAALLAALKDVEDSLSALQGSRARNAALQLAADAADASLQLSRHRHQAGLVDFATLLLAQRTALSSRLALQSARNELSLNLVRNAKALGGGWTPDTE